MSSEKVSRASGIAAQSSYEHRAKPLWDKSTKIFVTFIRVGYMRMKKRPMGESLFIALPHPCCSQTRGLVSVSPTYIYIYVHIHIYICICIHNNMCVYSLRFTGTCYAETRTMALFRVKGPIRF